MKRGTPRHPKTSDLADRLRRAGVPLWLSHVCAVGVLESLWHFTAEFAPQGDIGRYSDKRIAAGCGWEKNADVFVQLMVDSGWIDVDEKVRYVVHDWSDHADDAVKKRLSRGSLSFVEHTPKVTGHRQTKLSTLPDIGRLPLPEPLPEPITPPTPSLCPGNRVCVSDLNGQTSDRFEEFWERYPHQTGKAMACQVWLSVVTSENVAEVFCGLARWESSEQWARAIYPKAQNWLRDRAWQDHPAPARNKRADDDAEVIAHMQELERNRQKWASKS